MDANKPHGVGRLPLNVYSKSVMVKLVVPECDKRAWHAAARRHGVSLAALIRKTMALVAAPAAPSSGAE